ncbi:MAG: AsmA family protein [Nitrospirota bacterium]|nr:AsmA family protein [Nitrospirota bacterium]
MKKTVKVLIITLSVLAIVFAGVSLFIKSYLTDERIRSFVTEAAEKSLNRKVSLGRIKVSLFRGIVVRDFEIKEENGEDVFIKTKDFILEYQLLPLLSKRLVIDKLNITDPEVHIKKHPDGSFNFSGMTKADDAGNKGGEPGEKTSSLPVTLAVKAVSIKNAVIDYSEPEGDLKNVKLSINAALDIKGLSREALASEGKFRINILEILLKDDQRPFGEINIETAYDMEVDLAAKKLDINSLEADIMGVPVSLNGTVAYDEEAAVQININSPKIALSTIKGIFAGFLPEGMSLGGYLSLDLDINRPASKKGRLNLSGRLDMNKVSLSQKNIHPVLNGSVIIKPDSIKLEGVKLLSGSSTVDITGRIRDYLEYPDIRIDIKSDMLILDELIPGATETEEAKTPVQATKVREEPGPVELKLTARGDIDIKKTVYRGLSITNFSARYELKDNIFKIIKMRGDTLSGNFTVSSSLDLNRKGTRYSVSADIRGIKLQDVTKAFAPKAEDKLYGTVIATAEISGAGVTKENIKRNLKGNGRFSIADGAIKNDDVGRGLLMFLGLRELKEIEIQKADGRFTIAGGIINLTTLITNRDLILDASGAIGLDETLDIGINVRVAERLAPKLISQSAISGFLSEEKGWSSIPLRVAGTLSKPSYSVDTRTIGKKAVQKFRKKVADELLKILPGRKEETGEAGGKEKGSLDGLIKGIFGK